MFSLNTPDTFLITPVRTREKKYTSEGFFFEKLNSQWKRLYMSHLISYLKDFKVTNFDFTKFSFVSLKSFFNLRHLFVLQDVTKCPWHIRPVRKIKRNDS